MVGFSFFGASSLPSSLEVTPKRYDLRLEVRTLGVDDSFDGSLKAELDLLNLGHLRFFVKGPFFFEYNGGGVK